MNSNTVEFVLRMKDMMSGALTRVGSASSQTFNRMTQHANNMMGRNRLLGQSFDELQRRISATENIIRTSTIPSQIRSARRELESLQRMVNRHQGNLGGGSSGGSSGGLGIGGVAIGSMLGGFAGQAGTALLGVIKDGIGGAISGSMQKEQDVVGLTTFLGKKGATEAYANIRKDADISPYDTASLLEVNRALISAGLNAKDAREDSMNLANAISAVGGGNAELSRMAANMQQIKTVGTATAMDIKQFGMVGINIYEMLARSTGKSIAQVKEMDVSYNELAKAMAMARGKGGIYEGALEAQGNTRAGKWNTVKDKFSNALVDIGDSFSPIMIKVLDIGIKIADSIAPLLEKASPYIEMISSGLGKAIDYVMSISKKTGGWMDYLSVISSILSTIYSIVKQQAVTIFKIVSSVVEWLGKSEIIKDTFRLIGWILKEIILPVVGLIGDGLLWVWENVLKPILDGLETAYKWAKEKLGFEDESLTIDVNKNATIRNPDSILSLGLPTREKNNFTDLTRFGKDSAINAGEDKAKKNKAKSKEAGDTISGGGTKNITINLGKFFDSIQFTTLNTNETTEQLESVVLECLGRVLYNGAKVI